MRFIFALIACAAGLAGGVDARAFRVAQTPPGVDAPRLVVQTAIHDLRGVAFSRDGRRIATSQPGLVRTWDVATASQLVRMSTEPDVFASSVLFAAEDRWIVSANDDALVVWDARTGQPVRRQSDAWDGDLAVSPDGRLIALNDRLNCRLWGPDGELSIIHLKPIMDPVEVTGPITVLLPTKTANCAGVSFTRAGDLLSAFGAEIRVSTAGALTTRVNTPFAIALAAFSGDGDIAAVDYADRSARSSGRQPTSDEDRRRIALFRTDTGDPIRSVVSPDIPFGLALAADGSSLAAGGDGVIWIWSGDWRTPVRVPIAPWQRVLAFSPDGRRLAIGQDDRVVIVDVATGRETGVLQGPAGGTTAVSVAPDGSLVTGDGSGHVFSWNIRLDRRVGIRPLEPAGAKATAIRSVRVANDGARILTLHGDDTVKLWDRATGSLVTAVGAQDASLIAIQKAELSRDGQWIITDGGNSVRRWSVDGALVDKLTEASTGCNDNITFAVSPVADEFAILATCSQESDQKFLPPTLEIRSTATGKLLRMTRLDTPKGANQIRTIEDSDLPFKLKVRDDPWEPKVLQYTPDGGSLVVSGWKWIQIYDASKLERTGDVASYSRFGDLVAASPDGSLIAATAANLNTQSRVQLHDRRRSGKLIGVLDAPSNLKTLVFSGDSHRLITYGDDQLVRVWDLSNPAKPLLVATLASVDTLSGEGWAVIDPAGRYDASDPDGLPGLHWVRGDETLDLGQLKSRFYTPELLGKIWRGDPLPGVDGDIASVAPPPEVTVEPPAANATTVAVTLVNHGGGLGPVHVSVNGRPLDVTCQPPDAQAARAVLSCSLAGAAWQSDGNNTIDVAAESATDHVISRPRTVTLTTETRKSDPSVYGLIVGTSRFSGPASMNLQFAAHDAASFATALRIGASRLVGADHVHLTTLTSEAADVGLQPTKTNITRAFQDLTRAEPDDTVVIYFAGHGMSYGKDTYYYFTQDATSGDLSDAAVRAARTVSSDELRQWLKVDVVHALKTVVILDTCEAGAAVEALVHLADRRELSADQVRALALLKDATGSFVLMGSAADKVSYEASKYGQGLLTYALLQGMRGEATLDGGQLRVAEWFGYAVNKVQELARDLGGVQQPRLSAPYGTDFPVALLTDDDKRAIPVAPPKPQVLQPVAIDPDLGDALHLGAAMRARLRDLAQPATRGSTGGSAQIVYLDQVGDGVPGGIVPRVQYQPAADGLHVTIALGRDGKTFFRETLVVPADVAQAAARIAEEIVRVAIQGS